MLNVLLSSLYLAPVQYYSKLFRAERAIIEIHDNYHKQSYRNRCIIAAANGAGKTRPVLINNTESGKNGITLLMRNSAKIVKNAPNLLRLAMNISILLNIS